MSRSVATTVAVMLWHVAGCSKGEPTSVPCEYQVAGEAAIDQVVEGVGFAGKNVLSAVAGTHSATLTWHDTAARGFSYRPGPGTTSLTMVVSSDARVARHMKVLERDPSGARCLGSDKIEVDAVLDFRTQDGAFAEQWKGALQAGTLDLIELRLGLVGRPIAGSFRLETTSVSGEPVELLLSAGFGVARDGTIAARVKTASDAAKAKENVILASWKR